jgi:hypothetical protein
MERFPGSKCSNSFLYKSPITNRYLTQLKSLQRGILILLAVINWQTQSFVYIKNEPKGNNGS